MSDHIESLLLAISHARAERHAEAETILHTILADEPDNAHALYLLGQCALVSGRAAEAAALLARGLALRPGHRDSRLSLARAFLAAGRPQEALAALEPLAGETRLAPVHSLRGTALNMLKRPAEAVSAFTTALAAEPADSESQLNLGNAYAELDELEAAETHIRQAIELAPGMVAAHASLAHLLTSQGQLSNALAVNQRAIDLDPEFAATQWNQAVTLLLAGNFTEGWPHFEWRKRRFAGSFASLPGAEWDGTSLAGKTILVRAEQGAGDAIQFMRYLPLVAKRACHVVMECPASLAPLVGGMPGVIATVPQGARPAYDFWIDQLSLPWRFGTTIETIPYPAGYLKPDPGRAIAWDRHLPEGLRVGLAWAGSPLHPNDKRRSMTAAALAPIIAAGGRSIVTLQAGPRAGDVAKLFGLTDRSGRLTDWSETAAAISGLDLVITVDTAIAHLAGALGIPAWVMLPFAPDWRWMLGREDSPWYAGMRLFRQERPGDWAGVTERVATALISVVRPAYTISMPPLTWSVAPVTQAASFDAK